ncbi:MAG: glycosyl hydrolase [Saprospiraceae bacterium]|nr:glycosyl hydrolase [Saprospiraceae bacterium]
MKSLLQIFLSIFIFSLSSAQSVDPRIAAHQTRQSQSETSLVAHMESKNIGPTIFSGRISDIDVNPENPAEFYAAYASGGLWYTNNNGTTFTPVFDQEAVMTIGDVTVDWTNEIIWLGTGEVNSSRSSYAGVGMYKSTDGGKSWTHLGLTDTHHIGRVILHPTNKNIVWVAALGHLYTTNEERGIFKTIDGGKSWSKTLYVDDNSGAVDLVIDPANPNVLYAAIWERIRKAWNFQESGTGSGIYKSTDGGDTWNKMNTKDSGFPFNEGTGRIGLDIMRKGGKSYLYAILDNYNRRPAESDKKEEGLTKNSFTTMTKDEFASLTNEKLQEYLDQNNFPEKYSAEKVKAMVADGKVMPIALKEYVENANSLLFDTPVIGAEVYLSEDGGLSWKKTHTYNLDGVYNSYGYYFGQIKVNPTDPNQVYIMGVPILRSDDGGVNWKNVNGENVHSDHHSLWINPKNTNHIVNGNDGGINISYDAGETWIKCNMPTVGQFYYINVDNAQPYNVYGGTQDNGVWGGPNTYREGTRWQMSGDYPYDRLMGGDGMQVQIDNRDNTTVYTGYQFGNYFRINKKTGSRAYITPKHELGDSPYRWNWQSPILLSPHNQDIFYMGSNKLLRSMDQGNSFTAISNDLTAGGKKGDVAYGTLATIDESKFKFGLIYTGSDDGKVYRTKDGGSSWTNIGFSLPQNKWISRVVASSHEESRVYVSLNGYRDDDFSAYVYRSDDYGDTWKNIGSTLPSEPVNVIKEDPSNPNLLYVGTDHGVYASKDGGTTFMLVDQSMPRVPVHDLVVQEREHHLLVGTHGRSIYRLDISPLQEIDKAAQEPMYLYEINSMRYRDSWGDKRRPYSEPFTPELKMTVFSDKSRKAKLIVSFEGEEIQKMDIQLAKGIAEITYDLSFDQKQKKKFEGALAKANESKKDLTIEASDNGKMYIQPGTYEIKIEADGHTTSSTFKLK